MDRPVVLPMRRREKLGIELTVPRTCVDHVVDDELGSRRFAGRRSASGSAKLVSVAHPDFRRELHEQAASLSGVSL